MTVGHDVSVRGLDSDRNFAFRAQIEAVTRPRTPHHGPRKDAIDRVADVGFDIHALVPRAVRVWPAETGSKAVINVEVIRTGVGCINDPSPMVESPIAVHVARCGSASSSAPTSSPDVRAAVIRGLVGSENVFPPSTLPLAIVVVLNHPPAGESGGSERGYVKAERQRNERTKAGALTLQPRMPRRSGPFVPLSHSLYPLPILDDVSFPPGTCQGSSRQDPEEYA